MRICRHHIDDEQQTATTREVAAEAEDGMRSVGVVMLELVLGTPNVFQINALTRALLDLHLEGWNEGVKVLAYKVRSHRISLFVGDESRMINQRE